MTPKTPTLDLINAAENMLKAIDESTLVPCTDPLRVGRLCSDLRNAIDAKKHAMKLARKRLDYHMKTDAMLSIGLKRYKNASGTTVWE